jgi:hypothetical protein
MQLVRLLRSAGALVHSTDEERVGPQTNLLCDDRLATDGIGASGRQHPVQDRHPDGSLGVSLRRGPRLKSIVSASADQVIFLAILVRAALRRFAMRPRAILRGNVRHHVATATTLDGLCDVGQVPYMFYRSTRP